jgi:hypothetical protein
MKAHEWLCAAVAAVAPSVGRAEVVLTNAHRHVRAAAGGINPEEQLANGLAPFYGDVRAYNRPGPTYPPTVGYAVQSSWMTTTEMVVQGRVGGMNFYPPGAGSGESTFMVTFRVEEAQPYWFHMNVQDFGGPTVSYLTARLRDIHGRPIFDYGLFPVAPTDDHRYPRS